MSETFTIPATTAADGGWESYDTAIRIDATSAADLRPGTSSPEAATAHFYASLVRRDEAYRDVIPDDDGSEVLAHKLATLRAWTFEAVELVARRLRGQARCSMRIAMNVVTERGPAQSTDEVELRRQDDGRWLVTRPPT